MRSPPRSPRRTSSSSNKLARARSDPATEGKTIHIFTDGACKGNPGPGGWGALLRYNGREREIFGGEKATTNNRMELTAVIEALARLRRPSRVILHTDSQYVQKGITEWINGWKARGWRTAAKEPVKNVDLWKKLDEVVRTHDIDWVWVKGHAGHEGNERADELANKGCATVDVTQ